MELKFDDKGLIPAIVQDHYTKEVLTLAYMNAETLALTIAEGRTVFWSRSRQEIWRKGETSGNVQRVVSITADCDGDALVVEVVKSGPACHTGAESCFFNQVYLSDELKQFSWQGLYRLIEGRRTDPKPGSYTSYLFEKGKEKILKKVGEECAETIIAAKNGVQEDTVGEISDLVYHLMVLMAHENIPLDAVLGELINVFMMMPTFFLVLIVVALFGSGLFNVMVVMGLTSWVGNAKLMRAQAMSLRQRTFVRSAEAIGEGRLLILFRHVVPNGIFPIIANTTMGIASAILTESSLAFLGLGDPNVISWGQVIQSGKSYLTNGWWICLFGGLAIIYTVVTFYLIGDGLNRVLSPKLRNLGKEG